VAGVSVERSLPSTLVLRVTERRPAGWLAGPRGGYLVAEDGMVLARSPDPEPGLPSVGEWPRPLAPGERAQGLGPALRVAASLPPEVLFAVSAVRLEDGRRVEVDLVDGGEARYGPARDLADKNAAVVSMLRWADRHRVPIAYLDVSAPASPVLRPAGGTAAPSG
jgi:cell division protein FtsQ